ncbi:restriction endonuclease-like protein [Bacillus sp. FJAT-49732]|uniref:Restriction endonuclease-like protein n=1 Tax=Lederbergia citrisecunda TaxID=2833583 RepID=A0A942TSA0_9BACI|nr:restriction endonuclease-like protein [Lederbergia citrisecunda]MBS4201309.1 restriction endonuclease-like protein [Lederbergia citrisecunda]
MQPLNSNNETKELLIVEAEDFSLYIKGVPYDQQYESLLQYRKRAGLEKEMMTFRYDAQNVESIELYDIEMNHLIPVGEHRFAPIFFENRIYQLVITPKTERELSFYHENPGIREAMTTVGRSAILMGNLQFMNEVGLTTFSIFSGQEKLLEITLEIYPSKLNYKEDYRQLLEEVNEEIYNLAFHFIKKTYLGASSVFSDKPSPTEFFRLLEHYFNSFCQAIDRIEAQPHHQLVTQYEMVRGDRIKRLDAVGKRYLRNNIQLLQEIDFGIAMKGRSLLPTKGLNAKKTQSFDTIENRFIKWMMERLIHQIVDLKKRLLTRKGAYDQSIDEVLINRIRKMTFKLESYLKKTLWQKIGSIDRSVLNMVMQMKVGYRDAYKIYLLVTRGLALQGEMLKMSVKDVATLYEYWTYLKVGQILRNKYEAVDQTIVKATYGRLFVNLDQTRDAKQVFIHQHTGERITLSFQKNAGRLPTVRQKPDIMLEIEKSDKDYTYNYIFDAKYRIDFSQNNPGPLEEDINTMHRYRDAHVTKRNGPYERHAFGAYVLFPWQDEENYELHPFFESIDEVNIGGLPFLPRTTKLVERLVERLVESNPEELQQEGILPQGSISYWESQLEDVTLIGSINNIDDYYEYKQNGYYEIQASLLKGEWQRSKYLALYITQNVAKVSGVENGIQFYGEISRVEILEHLNSETRVRFHIYHWQTLKKTIRPVGYGIQTFIITTFSVLSHAKDLPELFMKSGEEVKLWRMLRRLTTNVKTALDAKIVDHASKIQAYQIGYYFVVIDPEQEEIHVMYGDDIVEKLPLETLKRQPSYVFRVVKETIFK